MYAIKGTSFRAILSASEALPDETVVESLPQSLLDAIAQQEATEAANHSAIRGQADQALTNLRAYRDLASPTNAQTLAIVKLLCRVNIGLIRLLLRKLDGAD